LGPGGDHSCHLRGSRAGSHRPTRGDLRHPRVREPELPRAAPHASPFARADRSRARLRGAPTQRRPRRRRMKRSSPPLPPRRSRLRPPPGRAATGELRRRIARPLVFPAIFFTSCYLPRPARP
jgi:hypothetical protein